jgi:hypothetical protein
MGLISDFVSSAVDILTAIAARLIADDVKQRIPIIVERLIDRAVSRLPDDEDREGRREEWRSYVSEIPNDFSKVWAAADFLRASRSIGRDCRVLPSWAVAINERLAVRGAKIAQHRLLRELRNQLVPQCTAAQCEFALREVERRFEPIVLDMMRRRLPQLGNYRQFANDVLAEFGEVILEFRRELQQQALSKSHKAVTSESGSRQTSDEEIPIRPR